MTPAVNIAKKAKIAYTLHSYTHDPASVESFPTIYVSAGRRGLEIELSPNDLKMLCSAEFYDLMADV